MEGLEVSGNLEKFVKMEIHDNFLNFLFISKFIWKKKTFKFVVMLSYKIFNWLEMAFCGESVEIHWPKGMGTLLMEGIH